jgi:hypothetical protein
MHASGSARMNLKRQGCSRRRSHKRTARPAGKRRFNRTVCAKLVITCQQFGFLRRDSGASQSGAPLATVSEPTTAPALGLTIIFVTGFLMFEPRCGPSKRSGGFSGQASINGPASSNSGTGDCASRFDVYGTPVAAGAMRRARRVMPRPTSAFGARWIDHLTCIKGSDRLAWSPSIYQVCLFTISNPFACNSSTMPCAKCTHSWGLIQSGLLQSGSSSFG